MRDFIIRMPDAYLHGDLEVYFPDERHEPMAIEPVIRCGQCKHSRTERHKGDEELVCWVRVTYGEAVPGDGYCFKGEL